MMAEIGPCSGALVGGLCGIAHHEPICFNKTTGAIDTSYCLTIYARIMTLFQWMDIDSGSLLYGLDHVGTCSDKIMSI